MKNWNVAYTAAGFLLAVSGSAVAAPAVGLINEATLVMFDTEDLKIMSKVDVKGVGTLAGIDLRPANKTLIGVNSDNIVFVIDPTTGTTTELSRMSKGLPMTGAPVIADFNPKADKLRYMTGITNHRVNVDTGEVTVDGSLAFDGEDMHAGETPNIVAASYTNSYGTPDATALYDVDATIGALIHQTSPNAGTLAAIGTLGVPAGDTYAFDVHTTADGTNTAYLVTQNVLHRVDLGTGNASAVGAVFDGKNFLRGAIRDVTILPAD